MLHATAVDRPARIRSVDAQRIEERLHAQLEARQHRGEVDHVRAGQAALTALVGEARYAALSVVDEQRERDTVRDIPAALLGQVAARLPGRDYFNREIRRDELVV